MTKPKISTWWSTYKLALAGSFFIMVGSLVNIGLFSGGFKVSIAIVLLPVFAFLIRDFPVLPASLFAAVGVFLLRSALDWLTKSSLTGVVAAYAPEMIFYGVFGLLLSLYIKKFPLNPYNIQKLLPLVLIDFGANFFELLVRMGKDVFDKSVLLDLIIVAIGRTLITIILIKAFDYYGLSVLRKEDAERYHKLISMTSMLKGELSWLQKSTSVIEDTMNSAYELYHDLKKIEGIEKYADTALNITKDIHEIKKEYLLIIRGIGESIEINTMEDEMSIKKICQVLQTSLSRVAQDSGKKVKFSFSSDDNFYTKNHYMLMSILHNLLHNAVEAAGTEPVNIGLTQYSDEDSWFFYVEDNCGGILPEYINQIFMPGFSSKINYATGEINRGIGLSLVKDLVENRLKGTVKVLSEKGSTLFTIQIPKKTLDILQSS